MTTERFSRAVLKIMVKKPEMVSEEAIARLARDCEAYMTALERVKEWYSELSVEDYDKKYGPYAHAIPLNEWIDEVLS